MAFQCCSSVDLCFFPNQKSGPGPILFIEDGGQEVETSWPSCPLRGMLGEGVPAGINNSMDISLQPTLQSLIEK